MAGKRSIPTDLFWDETFSGLCGETQSIFIGLVLGADDHGRGPASVTVLTRMLAKDPQAIHIALQELDTIGFLQCYQVEGKGYYHITRWDEWETLNKPARSRYPTPPDTEVQGLTETPNISGKTPENLGDSHTFLENPAIAGKILSEAEAEEKRKEAEGEVPPDHSLESAGTVIPFPTRGDGGQMMTTETTVKTLAQILHVPVTPALARLVEEFQQVPGLSLLGEANAARAWIDDQHNKKRKQTPMTVPFFRRWLQRALNIQDQQVARTLAPPQPTGTTGRPGPRLPDLMHLDDDVLRREEAVNG